MPLLFLINLKLKKPLVIQSIKTYPISIEFSEGLRY